MKPILHIQNLNVSVANRLLINNLGFDVKAEKVTALVGGSGSGKTTIGLSILQLLNPALKIQSGKIILSGVNLLSLAEHQMRLVRGKDIGMVFQEPLHAFNPLFQIGFQIDEVLRYHTQLDHPTRIKRMQELLDLVGLPDPERILRSYPHQLSGGMRQRAMIAQAIAAGPKLLIADEPTSSLDVTLQAKIMELFKKLQKELGLSMLLITHDLAMAQYMADDIVVLSQGEVVEQGACGHIMNFPKDDYTKKLIEATL
ncbi:MAG: ABC transporter ATP-binding protein [Candidatus Omnitrophica bacterium]|nr:ABC transporter ATP-binding protein [Candidatus Omnitrophota bacterium]